MSTGRSASHSIKAHARARFVPKRIGQLDGTRAFRFGRKHRSSAWLLQSPLTASNRRPPPYHGEIGAARHPAQVRPRMAFSASPRAFRSRSIQSRAAPSRTGRPETFPQGLSGDGGPPVVAPDPSRVYTDVVSGVRARSSASLIVSLRPASVARATSSAETASRARSTNSRPGVSSE